MPIWQHVNRHDTRDSNASKTQVSMGLPVRIQSVCSTSAYFLCNVYVHILCTRSIKLTYNWRLHLYSLFYLSAPTGISITIPCTCFFIHALTYFAVCSSLCGKLRLPYTFIFCLVCFSLSSEHSRKLSSFCVLLHSLFFPCFLSSFISFIILFSFLPSYNLYFFLKYLILLTSYFLSVCPFLFTSFSFQSLLLYCTIESSIFVFISFSFVRSASFAFYFLLYLKCLFHSIFIALFLHSFLAHFSATISSRNKIKHIHKRTSVICIPRHCTYDTLAVRNVCCFVIHLHRMRWYEREGEHTTSFSWGAVQQNVSSIYCVDDSVCTCRPWQYTQPEHHPLTHLSTCILQLDVRNTRVYVLFRG
jgi:hypothetical protein